MDDDSERKLLHQDEHVHVSISTPPYSSGREFHIGCRDVASARQWTRLLRTIVKAQLQGLPLSWMAHMMHGLVDGVESVAPLLDRRDETTVPASSTHEGPPPPVPTTDVLTSDARTHRSLSPGLQASLEDMTDDVDILEQVLQESVWHTHSTSAPEDVGAGDGSGPVIDERAIHDPARTAEERDLERVRAHDAPGVQHDEEFSADDVARAIELSLQADMITTHDADP